MKSVHWMVAALFLLAACGAPEEPPPAPREPGAGVVGYYCGMTLAEHTGPKGQLFVAGEPGPLWFSSVRDLFAYLQLEGATRRILARYVNDMGRAEGGNPPPDSWIDAQKAVFVVGSSQKGGMGGAEILPFADRTAAQRFAQQWGGRVVAFGEVGPEDVFPPNAQEPPAK
ncbi:MAG: nitrous oxide reductase accessory protein NosL [Magnetococcales bacterium]|nr:nitrous oxide reductase accessory protein NosL [Magnetococcales bacterium]